MALQDSAGWQQFFGNPASACAECMYAWDVTLDDADAAVRRMPGAARAVAADPNAQRKPAPSVWSPSAYAWHVADAVRIWAERFAAIAADPGIVVVPFDEARLADVRGYELMPPAGAVWALERAVGDWTDALERIEPSARFGHRDFGMMSAADAVRWVGHEAHHHAFDITRGLAG